MKKLRLKGYITMDEDGYIKLTNEGLEIATKIYECHTIITELFLRIGVEEKIAAEDACIIENVIREESFDAFKKYMNKK